MVAYSHEAVLLGGNPGSQLETEAIKRAEVALHHLLHALNGVAHWND